MARADATLDERRSYAPPLVLEANAKRRRLGKGSSGLALASDSDDECLLDPVECDAALAQQPYANHELESDTPIGRTLGAWELRLALAQADILTQTFTGLRAIAGPNDNGARLSATLGECWGRLRHLVDVERRRLADEFTALLVKKTQD